MSWFAQGFKEEPGELLRVYGFGVLLTQHERVHEVRIRDQPINIYVVLYKEFITVPFHEWGFL